MTCGVIPIFSAALIVLDSMSQIKGDITGRTSKERYEELILEL